MDRVSIRVSNWAEYQGEAKRYESTSWFRVENTIWMHPLWDDLDDSEFRATIFLLSYVSQKAHKEGQVDVVLKTLTRMSGIKEAILGRTIQKLAHLGMISYVDMSRPVLSPGENSAETVLRTNVTNVTNDRSSERKASEVEKINPELFHEVSKSLLEAIPIKVQDTWVQTYDPPWVKEQILSAANWCIANPQKRPKSNFAKFINSWLARGWEKHRKTIPSTAAPTPSIRPAGQEVPDATGTAQYLRRKESEYVPPEDKNKVLAMIRSVAKGVS